MAQLTANSIEIEYDTFGERSGRPLLLVMGLGAQMIHWDDDFCRALAEDGHFVVRFDNRDVGLSAKFDAAGLPDLTALMAAKLAGEAVPAPYTLDDMARDAVGVMDALDLPAAHICGASMGGMIVQTMAIQHPQRVLSVVSIMSTTGNPELPPATEEAMAALMSPPAADRAGTIERGLAVSKVIGSTAWPADEERTRARAALAYDRSFYPMGVARQMAAITAAGNRRPALETLDVPALVVHGTIDPLVPISGGHDTHQALRGSKLLEIDGMGHDLPPQAWPQIVAAVAALTRQAHV